MLQETACAIIFLNIFIYFTSRPQFSLALLPAVPLPAPPLSSQPLPPNTLLYFCPERGWEPMDIK